MKNNASTQTMEDVSFDRYLNFIRLFNQTHSPCSSDKKPKNRFNLQKFLREALGAKDNSIIGFHLKKFGNHKFMEFKDVDSQIADADYNDNFCFICSVLDGEGAKAENAISTKSIFIDLDYGKLGHNKESNFPDQKSALKFLRELPVKPSMIWDTGHGLDAVYLLSEEISYANKTQFEKFKKAKGMLYRLTKADATSSEVNSFRVPTSINDKSNNFPYCVPIKGKIIQHDFSIRYSVDEIIEKIGDKSDISTSTTTVDSLNIDSVGSDDPDLLDIPQSLKLYLETQHPMGKRSDAFHHAVMELHDLGATPACIEEILSEQSWVTDKYKGDRLHTEIHRVLSKPENHDIHPSAVAKVLDLNECQELSPAMADAVKKYCQLTGAEESDKIYKTARFLTHLASNHRTFIVNIPCGGGKTLSAICMVAVNANSKTPYILITPNRDMAEASVETLRKLIGETAVGLYLGWDKNECQKLTGRKHNYKNCIRNSPNSFCRNCKSKEKCKYSCSEAQLNRDAVVMTCASFLILCEKGVDFSKHVLICDEDFSTFADARFSLIDMKYLHSIFLKSTVPSIKSFIPDMFSSLEFNAEGITTPAPSDKISLGKLDGVSADLFKKLLHFINSEGRQADLTFNGELIYKFILFFRTCKECNSSFAYVLDKTKDGTYLTLKKKRIDPATFTNYSKFIILNASASCSTEVVPENIPVFRCKELDMLNSDCHLDAYISVGNPTKSKHSPNTDKGLKLLDKFLTSIPAGENINMLVPYNKENHFTDEKPGYDKLLGALQDKAKLAGVHLECKGISRGKLRGTNDYQSCNAVFMSGTSFFTTLTDYGLHLSLATGKDVEMSELTYLDANGKRRLVMYKGGFKNKLVQDIYARKAMSEMHQCIYRTAIRNGKPITAFITVPAPEWLTFLWDIFEMDIKGTEFSTKNHIDFFSGLNELRNKPTGERIPKMKIPSYFKYPTDNAWKAHKTQLMKYLCKYYDDENKHLVRNNHCPHTAQETVHLNFNGLIHGSYICEGVQESA